MDTDQGDLTQEDCANLISDTLTFCGRVLDVPLVDRGASRTYVYGFLVCRIIHLLRAAQSLLVSSEPVSLALAVLARAELESAANLWCIVMCESEEKRNGLADRFIEFGEYKHVELVKDCRDEYLASLTDEERRNFARREDVAEKFKKKYGEGRRKRVRYWNGSPIGSTIEDALGANIFEWWSWMCHFAHGSSDLFSKFVTISDDGMHLCESESCQKDVVAWTHIMAKEAFRVIAAYGQQEFSLELSDEDHALRNRLGLEWKRSAQGS